MTKSKLVKIIFDKCKNKKGLTKRQGEIADCFYGLANLGLKEKNNTGLSFEQVLLKEIKVFIYGCDYSHLEDIFRGV